MLEEQMYLIENIDVTIIAQKPKLRPYLEQMEGKCGPGSETSEKPGKYQGHYGMEGLGFTGAMEGIAAQAVCALVPALDCIRDDRCGNPNPCGGMRRIFRGNHPGRLTCGQTVC